MIQWEPNETLADRIRVGRARKRWTLRRTAKELGLTPSYLSDIENDRRTPSEEVLRRMSETLDLDFDDLMSAAGRLGAQLDDYLQRFPEARILFRSLSRKEIGHETLRKLIAEVQALDDEAGH